MSSCDCFSLRPVVKDIKRDFNAILDLGSGPGHLSKLLEKDKVQKSIMLDSSGNVDDSWCYLCLSMNSAATLYRDPDSDFEGRLIEYPSGSWPDKRD